jgi:hypothetical protein
VRTPLITISRCDIFGAVKEVFRHADSALVGLYQSILEDAEIATFIGNLTTQQALLTGVITAFFPLPLFFPTLYVLRDDDYPEAMDILQSILRSPPAEGEDWKCAECGVTVPANFAACWKCQVARGDDPTPPP